MWSVIDRRSIPDWHEQWALELYFFWITKIFGNDQIETNILFYQFSKDKFSFDVIDHAYRDVLKCKVAQMTFVLLMRIFFSHILWKQPKQPHEKLCVSINDNKITNNKSIIWCKVNQISNRFDTRTKSKTHWNEKLNSMFKPKYNIKKYYNKKSEFSLKREMNQ